MIKNIHFLNKDNTKNRINYSNRRSNKLKIVLFTHDTNDFLKINLKLDKEKQSNSISQ